MIGKTMAKETEIVEIKPQPKEGRVRAWVREMMGKNEPLARVFASFGGFSLDLPTIDYSRVNYSLTKAIFYASEVTDRADGKKYGGNFLYGAVFGKPIVNSATAFVIGETPHIETDEQGDADGEAQTFINTWLSDNEGELYRFVRNGMRDGDSYLRVNDDLTVDRIAPELVTKKLDPVSGKVLGYDVQWTVEEVNADGSKNKNKYVIREEYRKASPYYRQLKVTNNGSSEEVKQEVKADGDNGAERPLKIVHLANDQEANEVYGNTDYQNCYKLMSAYHAGYKAWSENVVFNNTSMPVVQGVKDPKAFMEANGKKDPKDGTYKVEWKGKSMLVIGEGGEAKFLQTDAASGQNSEKFLDKTFTLMAVASETPEYFLGKEMTSSRASTKEQLMIMIQKARRKQKEYTPVMNELTDLVFYLAEKNKDLKKIPTYKFVWGKILDDDLELNLKVIETLKREGIITDHTAAMLAGLGSIVEDVDAEIAAARAEDAEKADNVDPFKVPSASDQLNQ